MLHLYAYAMHYYQKATVLRPNDARMWCAVGKCLSRLSSSGGSSGGTDGRLQAAHRHKEAALLAYQRAVQCDDKEGVATRELAKMHREMGNSSAAAACYKNFLFIQDQLLLGPQELSGAAQAGMMDSSGVTDADINATKNSCIELCLKIKYLNCIYCVMLCFAAPVTDEAMAEACEFLAHYCKDMNKLNDAALYCSRYSGRQTQQFFHINELSLPIFCVYLNMKSLFLVFLFLHMCILL